MVINYPKGNLSQPLLSYAYGNKTSASTYAPNGGWIDLGISTSITPQNSANDIMILAHIGKISSSDWSGAVRLVRGSTVIGAGDSAGSRKVGHSSFMKAHDAHHWGDLTLLWRDSPSTTSNINYKLQGSATSNAQIGINRGWGDNNDTDAAGTRCVSSIFLWEIED